MIDVMRRRVRKLHGCLALAIGFALSPVAADAMDFDCDAALQIEKANQLGDKKPFKLLPKKDWVQTPAHLYCNYLRTDKSGSNVATNITADAKGRMWPFARDRFLKPSKEGLSGVPLAGVGEEAVQWTDTTYPYKGMVLIGATAKANGRIYELMLRMSDGTEAEKRAYLADTLKHMVETVR